MKTSLRDRLRQLWEQCELFESLPTPPERHVLERHSADALRDPVQERATPGTRGRRARGWPPVPPSRTKAKAKKSVRPRASRMRRPRVPRTNPEDLPFVERLAAAFERYNAELFDGELRPVMIRVSRRMKNRLGHYMAATPSGLPAEIAISRRHIRRDTWDEVLHTLVHEMVHQWQDERHLPIDHGAAFRRKAREVGISDRATRRVRPERG